MAVAKRGYGYGTADGCGYYTADGCGYYTVSVSIP
eukprot:COSAG01_NODE_7803_length_3052_cov_1.405350_1_plen_35_part_00